jgi:RimJ/RimL family protein N-acetyltransferase
MSEPMSEPMPKPMLVRPVVLHDALIRLEPLIEDHADALLAAMEPDTFVHMATCPADFTPAAVRAYVRDLLARPDQVAFTVRHRPTDRIIGSTSYMSIRPAHRGLEIGCTWIGSDWRGTGVNTSMKRLMLTHAFETLGAIRVELRTDARNARSRRAIEKLGAEQEALFRRHMVMADGRYRDSVVYAITDDRWPQVRAGLGHTAT